MIIKQWRPSKKIMEHILYKTCMHLKKIRQRQQVNFGFDDSPIEYEPNFLIVMFVRLKYDNRGYLDIYIWYLYTVNLWYINILTWLIEYLTQSLSILSFCRIQTFYTHTSMNAYLNGVNYRLHACTTIL